MVSPLLLVGAAPPQRSPNTKRLRVEVATPSPRLQCDAATNRFLVVRRSIVIAQIFIAIQIGFIVRRHAVFHVKRFVAAEPNASSRLRSANVLL